MNPKINKPTISVILPIRNEEASIEVVINSILNQNTDLFDLEIVAIDGKSTDKTFELLNQISNRDKRVRVILNNHRTTPYAFNLGLNMARGDYVAILGAHCKYDVNYLRICFEQLHDKKVAGCSGRVFVAPFDLSNDAKIVSKVLGSSFGVSSNSFRTLKEGHAQSVPYPVFKKSILLELGGYNVELARNQDNDMNHRIIAAGHKLYMTHATSCIYFGKSKIKDLLKYAWDSGRWIATSLRVSPSSMQLHHFVPALFVLNLIAVGLTWFFDSSSSWIAFLQYAFVVPLICYSLLSLIVCTRFLVVERIPQYLLLPIVFFEFHVLYGLGTLIGIIREFIFKPRIS